MNNNNDLIYKIWLSASLSNVASTVRKVLCKFSPKLAYEASYEEMKALGIKETAAARLSNKSLETAERILNRCDLLGIHIIAFDSPAYPRSLDRLPSPPFILYVKGSLEFLWGNKTAGFVGARRLSPLSIQRGEALAEQLIDSGKILISGGAAGADSIAASVSIDKKAPTVIVSGVDIDKYSPAANELLFRKAAENGAVISEYPPYTNARFFPERNRIIAALSDELYVLEASSSSGSIITGRAALKLKIPVYAYSCEGTLFDGCRELISLGAKELLNGTEVNNTELRDKRCVRKEALKLQRKIPNEMTGIKRHILEKLLNAPAYDNDFITDGYNMSQVLVTLTELELEGFIKALPGGKYELK